jgi:lipopolysaccharide export system permease protein
LRPYIIGASLISVFVDNGFYVVPASSEGFNNFRYTYLKGNGPEAMREGNTDVPTDKR